jgi:hypothetical protein
MDLLRSGRLQVFTLAVVVRGVVGWIFFGSVDLTNAMLFAEPLLAGHPPHSILVPYLPGIYQLVIWISGVLTVATEWPIGFCFKLFPILFDGVLAVAVHDALLPDRTSARTAGLLYAVAPTSILITAIHTQWDSIAFAFLLVSMLLVSRKSERSQAFAGAAFVLSLLAKPLALPFFFFLLPSPKQWLTRDTRPRVTALFAGMIFCVAGYLATLMAIGNPFMLEHFSMILDYAGRRGSFGLPSLLESDVKRTYSLAVIALLIPLYWKARLTRFEAVLLSFCAILGLSGLAPQYLFWPLPFLLVCRRFRFAALYGVITGVFLVIYYAHPGPIGTSMENLGAFAPLRALAWLTPDAAWLEGKRVTLIVFGDALLPLSLLGYFAWCLVRVAQRVSLPQGEPELTSSRLSTPVLGAMAFVAAMTLFAALTPVTADDYAKAADLKVAWHDMELYRGPGLARPFEPSWVIPSLSGSENPRQPTPFHAVNLALVAVIGWSAAAMGQGRHGRT